MTTPRSLIINSPPYEAPGQHREQGRRGRVLDKAERGESVTKDKDYAVRLEAIINAAGLPADRRDALLGARHEEQLRNIVDTVGKRGKAGQRLENVVSVAMLSEGWDAANVTHIMGLRVFTSQLLCEQVIYGTRRRRFEKGGATPSPQPSQWERVRNDGLAIRRFFTAHDYSAAVIPAMDWLESSTREGC